MGYIGSYIWVIRQKLGSRLLLIPGAQVMLVNEQGECLFQRRRDTGVWEFPGGSCEEGSSFTNTAIEELEEETGLSVRPEDLIPFGSLSDPAVHVVKYPNGDLIHCFALCFAAHRWTGDMAPEEAEVVEAAFFPRDRPPQPLHPPTRAVLDMYHAYLATGRFQAC
ncbi:NUDIX domain-containing protein [Embleya sp. NPDC050493]|uniref:NUDIX domain-containing protein n=1 Tax=Embleya sp. NPDC050493 TaxID=3363989 RepID=UPI00378B69FD